MKITTIGIDLAKSVFQIHGVDRNGKPLLKKQSKRSEMATFFSNILLASWTWKHVEEPVTGPVSSSTKGTRSS